MSKAPLSISSQVIITDDSVAAQSGDEGSAEAKPLTGIIDGCPGSKTKAVGSLSPLSQPPLSAPSLSLSLPALSITLSLSFGPLYHSITQSAIST